MSEYPNIRVSECPNTTDLTPTPLGFDRDAASIATPRRSIDRSIARARGWVVFFRRAFVREEYPVDLAPAPEVVGVARQPFDDDDSVRRRRWTHAAHRHGRANARVLNAYARLRLRLRSSRRRRTPRAMMLTTTAPRRATVRAGDGRGARARTGADGAMRAVRRVVRGACDAMR